MIFEFQLLCYVFLMYKLEDFLKEILKNEMNEMTEEQAKFCHPIFSDLVETTTIKKYATEVMKKFIAVRKKNLSDMERNVCS